MMSGEKARREVESTSRLVAKLGSGGPGDSLVAVKVIDDRGNELLVVKKLAKAEAERSRRS
mgnify:CR=1 FL=1